MLGEVFPEIMLMEAVGGSTQLGTVLPNAGKGCTVKGNNDPAKATMYVASPISGVQHHFRAQLSSAAKGSAIMAVGLTRQTVDLMWCTKLELSPLAFVFGQVNDFGIWLFQTPMSILQGGKRITIYIQYAFADSSQSNGLGLSDLAGYRTPALPGAHGITRIYAAPAGGQNGSELATTGIVDRSFGLVVGWRQ